MNKRQHFDHCIEQNLGESTEVHVLATRNHKAKEKLAVFKSLDQRTNYCKILLSTDIERNPGPGIVDPIKTIAAPYSQGNMEVFGTANTGTQCVAMSLSALVYNFRNSITSSADLVQVMNTGNNMYSALSQSAKERLLLLTELPVMVSLSDTNYELRYSESYTGLLNRVSPPIADFPYVTSLSAAFNSLVTDNYHAFILTVDIFTVAIYCLPDTGYKVFDSHNRDLLGMADPYGTCTLIEIDSLMNLVQYFQNLYTQTSNIYEIKGVNIIEMQSNSQNENTLCVVNRDLSCNEQFNEINLCSCRECCAISFYCICFLTLKACNYWTSETVDSIVKNGKAFHQKYHCGKHLFFSDLPDKLDIDTGHVEVVTGARSQGYLSCNAAPSKEHLKRVILDNKESSTGFLMWISSYCISCVFQRRARQKLSYNVFAYNDTGTNPTHVPQVFSDLDSVIDVFCALVQSRFNRIDTKYEIAFLRCSCELSNDERKQIIRKHKCAAEKASIVKRRRKKTAQWI